VREIEHSSFDHAFFSCDQIRLRVKSDLKFGCSISLINKRRSITELNSDSRPQHFIVKSNRRQASRTIRFCGVVPPSVSGLETLPAAAASKSFRHPSSKLNAGFAPAFAFAHRPARLRGTEFISVSGLCPERSALHSDLRLKRTSGSAAAPELPHAPMNSPDACRAGFPS